MIYFKLKNNPQENSKLFQHVEQFVNSIPRNEIENTIIIISKQTITDYETDTIRKIEVNTNENISSQKS